MKILRVSTIPLSLNLFCRGLFRDLSEEGHEVIAISSPGKDLSELREREGIRTYAVPMERRIAPLKDLISLIRLIGVIHREKPEIIHSITPKAGLLTMAAARICGVPHRIHTFTGLVFPTSKGLKKKLLMFTDSLTCKFATRVHAEGKGVKRDLQQYNITNKNIEIILNGSLPGIDTDYFNPGNAHVVEKAKLIEDKNYFTFIFIGRIGVEKGINELIKSFIKLHEKYPFCRLLLIGWMEMGPDKLFSSIMDEINRNEAILYMGVQEDVRPWLLASDCLILPSYREGFPNVVLEAGAMGKPCIVTDVNGSNEIVVNEETGLIVPVKDEGKLTEAMERFVSDSKKALIMGEKAIQRVKKLYERKALRQALKSYYNSLING